MGNGCTSIKAGKVVEAKTVLPKLKLVVVGESTSGKTCVVERFQKNSYQETYEPTKEVNITSIVKKVNVPDQGIVSIELWDVPGHEGVDLRKTYYLNADAVVVVIDLSDEDAYTYATQWKRDVISHVRHNNGTTNGRLANDHKEMERSEPVKPKVGAVPILLLGNKFDLAKETFFRKQYSMCNGNSSKVTFGHYQANVPRNQSNNNINGLVHERKSSVASNKRESQCESQAENGEKKCEQMDTPPAMNSHDDERAEDVSLEAAANSRSPEEERVDKEEIPVEEHVPTDQPGMEVNTAEQADNNGNVEKPDSIQEEKMECDPSGDEKDVKKEEAKEKEDKQKSSDVKDDVPNEENKEKTNEQVKEQSDKEQNVKDDVPNEENKEKTNEQVKEQSDKEEQKKNAKSEESIVENGQEDGNDPPVEPVVSPASPKGGETHGETVKENGIESNAKPPAIIEDLASNKSINIDPKEYSTIEGKPEAEDKGEVPTQRKLKKVFPKDLVVKENGDIEMEKEDDIQKKDPNMDLLELSPGITESVSMISLLPPCVEQLESFAEENGFVAGIPVSAKDAKGGVHEALQSLIRHLISKRREKAAERKRKTDELSVRSRLSVSKRTRKTQNRSLTEDFEPLQEVGIIEIDEVLSSSNSTLRDSEVLSTTFREAIHDFKRECYSRKLIGGKQVSVEECVSALKETVQSSRVTSHEKNDVRLALLMRDTEPSFTLVATEMNGFVNLQVTDENHDYVILSSTSNEPVPLSPDVVSVLQVYHEKVHPVCSEVMKRSSELERLLQQHFDQISSKEEKAWDMAVAAGHLQSNVRRILTGVAQGKARVRGTLEEIKETGRVVGSTQTKIKAALLF